MGEVGERRAATVARQHWADLTGADTQRIAAGLINATFLLQNGQGERTVLQRLHPVFPAQVNLDIQAITERLAAAGLTTPRLVPTRTGALWVEEEDGIWRAQTFVPGIVRHKLADPAQAREAGRLVGRFHRALAGFDHRYRASRPQVHDTIAHLGRLAKALVVHGRHRLYDRVAAAADRVLADAQRGHQLGDLPLRHCHGDLKVSNLMFDDAGLGLCLIDLDTLALMQWPLEMGDALRSWCNPNREDESAPYLDLALLSGAVEGYRETAGGLISQEEWEALLPGLSRICLELSARFLADALNESYFAWDTRRYPGRGEHNLARGLAMWRLYRDTLERYPAARRSLGLAD